MKLYRFRARLTHGFEPRPVPDPIEVAIEGYSALVEIEVLRSEPAGYVIVVDVAGLALAPWKPTGFFDPNNLDDSDSDDDEMYETARPMRICIDVGKRRVPRADLDDLRLSLTLLRHRDGKCMTICSDAPLRYDQHIPAFVSNTAGDRTLQLLGAKHVVQLDAIEWSKYQPRPDKRTFHHGDEGQLQRGDPHAKADIADLGSLSYSFLPSSKHGPDSWARTLPNIAEFWDNLGEWRAHTDKDR